MELSSLTHSKDKVYLRFVTHRSIENRTLLKILIGHANPILRRRYTDR